MNTKAVNLLNVGLIVASLLLAWKIPFELFLFSYAVLGPLHYLTEINWLNDRNYFVQKRTYILVFILLAAVITLPILFRLPLFSELRQTYLGSRFLYYSQHLNAYFILFAIIFSIGLIMIKRSKKLLIYLLAALLFAVLVVMFVPQTALLVAMFVPTVIHVYFFTLLFMLYGALNEKGSFGMLPVFLLLLCPFVIMFLPINTGFTVNGIVQSTFDENNFNRVKMAMASLLNLGTGGEKFNLLSVLGIRLQIFLAFAYTYHYLNWFSKTSLIGWAKNINGKKLMAILILWAISVSLYYYNYRTGLLALFFLSLLHVLLELPLNVLSVKTVFSKLFSANSKH